MALVLYAGFAAAALAWMHWREPGQIAIRLGVGGAGTWTRVLAAGGGIGIGVVALSAALTGLFGWARELERQFAAVLGRLTALEILILAGSSGVGEELLFRGAVQPAIGWTAASLLFGAVHVPLNRSLWPWPAFAAGVGFLFGCEESWTGSLWTPVVSHAAVNGLNLWRICSRADANGK